MEKQAAGEELQSFFPSSEAVVTTLVATNMA